MKLPKSHRHKLTLSNQKIEQWVEIESGKILSKLGKPLTSALYKLYVLYSTKTNQILYVGTTKMSLKSRLNSGLKANGESGYHGYKWKDEHQVNISVWAFPNLDKTQIENIEAELAFTVRLETGKWPIHQNEIHFNNSFQKIGNMLAKEIYDKIKNE